MNLDTEKAADDAALLNDPEIAEILTTRRRSRPIRFAQVRKLVETLRMGRERHANLESNGTGHWGRWKLRFTLRDGKGAIKRKSIVIEDALIAGWVRDYLDQARKERPAYRAELQEQEHSTKPLSVASVSRLHSLMSQYVAQRSLGRSSVMVSGE